MLLTAEDTSDQKLILFYCSYTNAYIVIISTFLYFTDRIYNIGKYDFIPVITLIIVLEFVKYIVGNKYYRKIPPPVLGRSEQNKKNIPKKNNSRELFKAVGLMGTMVVVYYILAVLFGAQVFNKQEETFMLSVLLSVLTILPACINCGTNSVMLLLFGLKPSSDLMGDWLLTGIQLTLFGAWLGAFVIPLDWDRPWQEWPISCAYGAVGGYMGANVLVSGLIYSMQYYSRKSRRMR